MIATVSRIRAVLSWALMVAAAATAFSAGLDQKAQAGGVTGVATPINLADAKAPTVDFKLVLDTHSVPMNFDIAKIALLGDGKQLIVSASKWTGGKGGHHLSGTLSFPAGELRSAGMLVLTLQIAGEKTDLTFRWNNLPGRAGS